MADQIAETNGTIVIYGATGNLGQRVAFELIALGAKVRLGGRDTQKLRAASADLARRTGWQGHWQAATLDDAAGLRTLLKGCRVIVNAGPTADGGHQLIETAIDTGTHYIDAAGSQPYIHHVFEHYGPAAERRGAALVPAFGFDYALGDCLVYIVARSDLTTSDHPTSPPIAWRPDTGATLRDMRPARQVVIGYAIEGSDVSANSLQFAAETRGGGELFYESGAWTPARLGIYRRTVDFPAPFGRQPMARYAAGEIVTVPRHTPTQAVTTLITARSLVPHPALIPIFPYLRPLVALARRTPARHLLRLALDLRSALAPATPDAPGSALPQPPRFAIVVEVDGHDGARRYGVVQGGDFHQVTVATLALGARALAAPTFNGRGALPPAAAVQPEQLLTDLRKYEVAWHLGRA